MGHSGKRPLCRQLCICHNFRSGIFSSWETHHQRICTHRSSTLQTWSRKTHSLVWSINIEISGWTYILNMRAYDAFHLFCGKTIELMCLLYVFLVQIFCIIMAKPTSKKFVAFFTLLHTCSLVMTTSMLHHLIFFLCSIIFSFDFLFTLFGFRWWFLFLNLIFTSFFFNYLIFSALLIIVFPLILIVILNLFFFGLLLLLRWLLLLFCVILLLLLLLIVFVSLYVIIYSLDIMLIDMSTSIESRKVKCSREIVTHWWCYWKIILY